MENFIGGLVIWTLCSFAYFCANIGRKTERISRFRAAFEWILLAPVILIANILDLK